MNNLINRFKSPGPKRILSLDGGGIRGALTLGYLKKVEDILKKQHGNNPNFRLSDYFDLIGGTSTGSIIAGALCIGMSVDEIKNLYMDLGGKIFGEKHSWWNPFETAKFLKAGYNHANLEKGLKSAFGDITLGSDKIKTGLCVVAKRADTNSIWPLINHPEGKFYDSADGRNKNIALWQAIRASSAAPTYFVPQMIDLGEGQRAAFVDGGVSMANNPALTLLMVATLKGFPFHWPTGEDNILVVSIGTGFSVFKKMVKDIDEATLLTWASNVQDMMMQDASWQNQLVLQWLSNSPTAKTMDMEMGDLNGDVISGDPKLSYLRYNCPLTQENLNSMNLGKTFNQKDVDGIVEMSNAGNRELLYKIGEKASVEIKEEHFPIKFKIA